MAECQIESHWVLRWSQIPVSKTHCNFDGERFAKPSPRTWHRVPMWNSRIFRRKSDDIWKGPESWSAMFYSNLASWDGGFASWGDNNTPLLLCSNGSLMGGRALVWVWLDEIFEPMSIWLRVEPVSDLGMQNVPTLFPSRDESNDATGFHTRFHLAKIYEIKRNHTDF